MENTHLCAYSKGKNDGKTQFPVRLFFPAPKLVFFREKKVGPRKKKCPYVEHCFEYCRFYQDSEGFGRFSEFSVYTWTKFDYMTL